MAKKAFFAGLERLVDGVLSIGTLNREYWRYYFGDRVPLFDMPYAVDNEFFQRRAQRLRRSREELMAELELEAGRQGDFVCFEAAAAQALRSSAGGIQKIACREWGSGDRRPYLVIVGDGEMRAELERRHRDWRGYRFCGFRNQSEMPRFFDIASVFVFAVAA